MLSQYFKCGRLVVGRRLIFGGLDTAAVIFFVMFALAFLGDVLFALLVIVGKTMVLYIRFCLTYFSLSFIHCSFCSISLSDILADISVYGWSVRYSFLLFVFFVCFDDPFHIGTPKQYLALFMIGS